METIKNTAVGSVVRSVSGRDKKREFMIVGLCDDGERVLLADGVLRKLSCPKKKSVRHIAVLAAADDSMTSIPKTDEELSSAIRAFCGVKKQNQNCP